jgi:hypothetical protein
MQLRLSSSSFCRCSGQRLLRMENVLRALRRRRFALHPVKESRDICRDICLLP